MGTTNGEGTNSLYPVKYLLTMVITVFLMQGCGSVPITGRRQLMLVSDQEVISLSLQQYQEYINTANIITGTSEAQTVQRVGMRIAKAVETFLKNNGASSEIKNYTWEFKLVKDNSINAFAMPGGKVVVYSGLLPVTQNEASLAVVIGHEIGHVVAKHANERISQQLALQYGGAVAGELLGGVAATQIGQTVFGLGAQMGVMLPYARKQEYEADELGLIFMAMAGYDPRVAIPFWTRMAQSSQGGKIPEFLSTHPTDAKRISNMEKILPKALKYYSSSQPIK
ncbi:M48 family metallopeptidase [Anaerorudis cellulosivorans]|uniref:M48 family metallopeptidase n=1 Tax=Anaerorudis cellulosivorans TaxID=3397862 RepID=UPI00221FDACD|nr:M48 family metallopeptidase [Seramator thermalis]MCW1734190.1 M48 family metallopeptidase [Seramator thermalis]